MQAQWHFVQPKPGDKNREPILGEFFATDAISNPAEALIREGIQNSLDAGLGGLVCIRIYVSGETGGLSATSAAVYFDGARPHIDAEGNGLHDAPILNDACPFLTFEDFGTSGLTGDVTQWHDQPGVANPFYYFFRAEGQSGKGDQDRGRWGVGKTVFPRSSRISEYFGLTLRADDQRQLLMGQSMLKSHSVGDVYFSPDGYFGLHQTDGLTLPVDDSEFIQKFSTDFRLKRARESGLSIVVPWCDPEITEQSLVVAVCRDYFYPILAAKLEVIVATPSRETLINHESILNVSQSIADQLPEDLVALLRLAEWATEQRPIDFINIAEPPRDRALNWTPELFSEDLAMKIRAALQTGQRIALRVPLVVREKNKEPRPSFFDVFLAADPKSESGRPVFVREGIIISDVRAPRTRGVLSLVVVENDALATLLGDSENPAHTQWQKDSSNYKGKYINGPSYIRFVVRSVSEIVRMVTEGEDKTDESLLLDLFYLPIEKELPTTEEVTESEDKLRKPPSSHGATRFKVHRVKGGFTISSASKNGALPDFFEVLVAYDVRRGNPLKKYYPADFDLSAVTISSSGIDVKRRQGNRMVAAIRDPQFTVTLSGFDEHRDLFIRVSSKEEFNDSED
jgi:hypothetical protein